MSNLLSKTKHSLIKFCKLVLQKDDDITTDDFCQVRLIIENQLFVDNLSPSEIKSKYQIDYTDFGMYIKKSLGIKLKSTKDAINDFYRKSGSSVTDEKLVYKKLCQFNFDPYTIPEISGYELLLERGIYHPVDNPDGMCRDHIMSVEYGWRNKIDPKIISNVANCQYLTNLENVRKGSASWINLDQLLKRIDSFDFSVIDKSISRKLPLSSTHRKKLSESSSRYRNVTNGITNLRILKTDPIPNGFRIGLTRKKLVPPPGFEPGN